MRDPQATGAPYDIVDSSIAMKHIRLFFTVVCCAIATIASAQEPSSAANKDKDQSETLPTIASKVGKLQKIDGYMPLYWQASAGKLFMEIGRFNEEILSQVSLPAGLGSNPVGLDRGQLGSSSVVSFERIGPKVLMTQPNYSYRAITSNEAEKRAVHDSFAQSVLWGFKVEAEEGGRVLVDATSFFMRDAHGVVDRLRQAKQGSYKLDDSRSALYLGRTKGFPQNTEIETTLTFTTDGDPGRYIRDTTPSPAAVTLREHHSFVQLRDLNYNPRKLDPRAPSFGILFYDYASPITEPIEKRWIQRHRLEKKDPTAAVSEPVKPIIYYVDNGTPEPIRSALLEGASWWNQAFEAAGYINAFQVKVLPDSADPMDIRYNMINWVHRSTRGWSYGASVVDPRTGEIIKGKVTLGSLRVRQDYMIYAGLLSPYKEGQKPDPRMLETALARLRQLAAHEVGHTLGLQHNYIASTQGRASVRDYPPPWVKLAADGSIDLSQAYTSGIGDWDKVTIKFGYSDFAPGANEHSALNGIIDGARDRGLTFLTDQDARPTGSASPYTNLWDNGKDPIAELQNVIKVRASALEHFGENNIPEGTSLAQLQDVLVPVYLYHRYQTESVNKTIGGLNYSYALRGD